MQNLINSIHKSRKRWFIETNKATLREHQRVCDDAGQLAITVPFGGSDSVILMNSFMHGEQVRES